MFFFNLWINKKIEVSYLHIQTHHTITLSFHRQGYSFIEQYSSLNILEGLRRSWQQMGEDSSTTSGNWLNCKMVQRPVQQQTITPPPSFVRLPLRGRQLAKRLPLPDHPGPLHWRPLTPQPPTASRSASPLSQPSASGWVSPRPRFREVGCAGRVTTEYGCLHFAVSEHLLAESPASRLPPPSTAWAMAPATSM